MKTNFLLVITALTALLISCGKKTQETKPIRKDVTETVFASGLLEANGTYNLNAQTDGYLVQVNFEEGDTITKNQVLAVVDNKQNLFNNKSATALYEISKSNLSVNAPSLVQAKNSSIITKQKLDLDSVQAIRYKKLFESNSVSRIEYDNMMLQYQTSKVNYANSLASYNLAKQQAEQQLIINEAQKDVNKNQSGNNEITAVFNGKVYQKLKQKGDFVKKGDVIATIGDASIIYAKVSVDESNISKIKVGQEAIIQLNTYKEKIYKGKVAEIYPSFDESKQSFICKIIFSDSLDFKIVNTQLQSNIIVGINKNALLIPRNYLDFRGNVKAKGKKEPVKVITQFVSNDWVQVLSGIDENTILVTDNIKDNKVENTEVGAQLAK